MTESVIPRHLGLILDGNRRWARTRGLPTLEGHRAGYKNLKTITKTAFDRGIKVVSAYIFSTENWNRSKEEVAYLMDLAMWIFKNELKEFEKENIKIVFLGTMKGLSKRLQNAIKKAEERTQNNTKGTLALCFNYGGQDEIVDAVKTIVGSEVEKDDISKELIEQNLYGSELPPVDLVIRTSNECRISNFMLWRIAYAELIFCSEFWPDYSETNLERDMLEYSNRQRRFGK